ncbi:endo alpha-1,4 polygalactosaminidase [Candidatus Peregrinibacteria bacterium CG10_big_fil_rev_8_21_14_0_10_36_19]|nr:MAG: endo alpha-1,4 polygalactosaminidase [Candidatus Peregrinibacteria bacterium CG10_big_fil_rev_8_21_14_0_10_36_19]
MNKTFKTIVVIILTLSLSTTAFAGHKKKAKVKKTIQKPQIEQTINTNLYTPKPGTSWHWQLDGKINTNYDVEIYNIDLEETSQKTIDELHSNGKKVICYFSAGTYEKFRSDAKKFQKKVLGKKLDGWAGEKWLDIANYESFSHIMESRLDLAVKKQCDGVEADNVDAYTNKSGFKLNYDHQLRYNKWLAEEAHKRNLSIALKNNLDQIPDLVNYFDFAINEQCFEYNECDKLTPFIKQNKAVLGVEYELDKSEFCEQANRFNFSWLKANYDLNKNTDSCK